MSQLGAPPSRLGLALVRHHIHAHTAQRPSPLLHHPPAVPTYPVKPGKTKLRYHGTAVRDER
jgi:hypothetical protein